MSVIIQTAMLVSEHLFVSDFKGTFTETVNKTLHK